ncbi:MAG: DNA polymerase I, partial [Chitinophagaceae bacterium]|nr:DNA polymerase I [Chitinophagaceae bacterium]
LPGRARRVNGVRAVGRLRDRRRVAPRPAGEVAGYAVEVQSIVIACGEFRGDVKMLLQVHDELVFDALQSEVHELKPLIIENMQSAMELPNDVPIIAECGEGTNWLEAH